MSAWNYDYKSIIPPTVPQKNGFPVGGTDLIRISKLIIIIYMIGKVI